MPKVLSLVFTLLSCQLLNAQDLLETLKTFEIPSDSQSPFDFRGTTESKKPTYQKLYEAKTYWELHKALEAHLSTYELKKANPLNGAEIDTYFTCKQAYIKTCYIFGKLDSGDRLMLEFHPKFKADPETLDKQLRINFEDERIKRMADQIREMTADMGDVFADGPPKDIHELYAPILKIIRELQGQ
ncbi:MAG: hypothetical protein ACSHYF_18065 [Verrucomicrobiaceae bacterium]